MNKTAIAPAVSLLAYGIQVIFHQEIPQEVQDSAVTLIVNIAAFVGLVYGIIKNHKTEA